MIINAIIIRLGMFLSYFKNIPRTQVQTLNADYREDLLHLFHNI
jgi:hypothetical protein